MTLWLLPLGTPLRREAEEIVGRSVDRDLTADEWAEVERLRNEADLLDASVRDEQQARSEDLYSYAVAEQKRMIVEGGSAEEWLINQERFAVAAALRVVPNKSEQMAEPLMPTFQRGDYHR
jgi:hypothetical protein